MSVPGRRCEGPWRRWRSRFPRWLLLLATGGAGCGSEDAAPGGPPSYQLLSETGLYAGPTLTLASSLRELVPAFPLWSDGADKRRWLELPPGANIDTSDMNRWSFPVGTRVWKEFSRGGLRLETRLIERFGPEPDDYWMGAFVWSEDQRDAVLAPDGLENLLGTAHDAPAQQDCTACHNGEPGRILGISALQLGAAPAGSMQLAALAADGLLSHPPPVPAATPPGDPVTAAALGYLHANCGSCHNPRGTAWPDTQMLLRLGVEEADAQNSGLYQSVIGEDLQYFRDTGGLITLRVDPGRPESSGLIARMAVRGPLEQMPPLATEAVDDLGIQTITRWIESLEP